MIALEISVSANLGIGPSLPGVFSRTSLFYEKAFCGCPYRSSLRYLRPEQVQRRKAVRHRSAYGGLGADFNRVRKTKFQLAGYGDDPSQEQAVSHRRVCQRGNDAPVQPARVALIPAGDSDC